MITNMIVGDTILLKPINTQGFVCNQGKVAYFVKQVGLDITCSLKEDLILKHFITVKDYQINTVIDSQTKLVKYQHNPSDGL